MRKILLTSVGVAALAVGANATDFTLSGTAILEKIAAEAIEIQVIAANTALAATVAIPRPPIIRPKTF